MPGVKSHVLRAFKWSGFWGGPHYYETILEESLRVAKEKIFITSLFWDGDIDFITKVTQKPESSQSKNYSYLNTYSLPRFEKFCLERGASKVSWEKMQIDVDLPAPADPSILKTSTSMLQNNTRLEHTGPIILSWKLVEITL